MMYRTEGRHGGDALAAAECAEGLMLDVAALQDDGAAHLRAADFKNVAGAGV